MRVREEETCCHLLRITRRRHRIDKGKKELSQDLNAPEMAELCVPLSWMTLWGGEVDKAIEIARTGLTVAQQTKHNHCTSQLNIFMEFVHMNPAYEINDMDKGFEYARKSLAAAKQSGEIYCITHAKYWLGWAHMKNEEYEKAIKLMKASLDVYKKTGHSFHIAQTQRWLGRIYQRTGVSDAE